MQIYLLLFEPQNISEQKKIKLSYVIFQKEIYTEKHTKDSLKQTLI